MTGNTSQDNMDFWLAHPLDEVVNHYRNQEKRPLIVRQTRAPKKDQGTNGTWRVVKLQDDPKGIILTVAWQPPVTALGFNAELG